MPDLDWRVLAGGRRFQEVAGFINDVQMCAEWLQMQGVGLADQSRIAQ